MEQPAPATLTLTLARLTLASVLVLSSSSWAVQALPVLPYSSRDAASQASSQAVASQRADLVASTLAGLVPPPVQQLSPSDLYLLGQLSALLDSGDSRSAAKSPSHAIASSDTSYEGRPRKRFDFGFSGLDNIDHILTTLNKNGRGDGAIAQRQQARKTFVADYDKLKSLMMQAG